MLSLTKRLVLLTSSALLCVVIFVLLRHQIDGLRVLDKYVADTSTIWNLAEQPPSMHTVLRSVSTFDGRYLRIDLAGVPAFNPNIVPHPVVDDLWIIVAQLRQESERFTQLVCNAHLIDGVLRCLDVPSELPIKPTYGDKCHGDLAFLALNRGPHDARVFYGPIKPYIIYGSNSEHTCFGQWVHDFRSLVEWAYEDETSITEFSDATELQRPPPWHAIEKNWFLFWDIDGQMYVHYDLFPRRAFAKVESSGSVGSDLSLLTASDNEACMESMPTIGPELESIHQATNSLSITMCRRGDPWCTPDVSNTYIFTIFQHKKYFNFHATYEPYVLVFEQSPPFRVRAISRKPLWISGRKARVPAEGSEHAEEMIYITSMSWKERGQKYHGFMDDTLWIAFGIEDEATAAIDVTAEDLFQDLGFC